VNRKLARTCSKGLTDHLYSEHNYMCHGNTARNRKGPPGLRMCSAQPCADKRLFWPLIMQHNYSTQLSGTAQVVCTPHGLIWEGPQVLLAAAVIMLAKQCTTC
jgi:hypothetical protein